MAATTVASERPTCAHRPLHLHPPPPVHRHVGEGCHPGKRSREYKVVFIHEESREKQQLPLQDQDRLNEQRRRKQELEQEEKQKKEDVELIKAEIHLYDHIPKPYSQACVCLARAR